LSFDVSIKGTIGTIGTLGTSLKIIKIVFGIIFFGAIIAKFRQIICFKNSCRDFYTEAGMGGRLRP
jgi:hypothetical protein